MIRVLKILLNIGLVLFFVIIFSAEARAEVGTPKIIKLMAPGFISLTGTAPSDSEVLIYLDNNFIGRAEAKAFIKADSALNCSASAASGTDCYSSWYFQYNPTQKLADGAHFIIAVAQDKTSLVLSAPTDEIKFAINAIPAPTLIAPNEKTATADLTPPIIGLTKDSTLVKIFIDDILNGQTGILKHDSGTANFIYKPKLNLDRGFHKIWATAEDVSGQASPKSEFLNFRIELPLPAPTLFSPVVNRDTSSDRPFIVGLAKNNSKIKIYIDEKYSGELTVKNHLSGTANFAYKPRAILARGKHSVYTVAVDQRGKESIWSNIVNFSTRSSAIAESAEEGRERAPVATAEIKQPIQPSSAQAIKNKPAPIKAGDDKQTDASQNEKAALGKIENLIGADDATPKNDRGMVNEGKQNQGKLKFSIILFILFLVGVVAWLLWVNRELVKERRAQAEAEENKNNSPSRGQDNKLF